METFFLVISLILMFAGLIGAIIPIIPSVPIIYAGFLIYGVASGWEHYGLWTMIFFGVVTVLSAILDYVAGAMGAKKYGASRAGIVGSIVGSILGLIFLNVPGLIIGTFAGALTGELCLGRTYNEAFQSGWGAFLGFVAGVIVKLIIGSFMIGIFLWKVFI